MCSCYLIFAIFIIIIGEPVMSSWEFAVSTQKQINFYASDWESVTSAAHQFDELSAIAFDETEEMIYFNDQQHSNGTIFSLKLSDDGNHRIEKIVQKTKNEKVQGIAFDPIERMLYWTDAINRIIYQKHIDTAQDPSILIKLSETKMPYGIAIDICRRKLYWTNANHRNPSIERISLDGSKYETLIDTELFMPKGIVVDQYTKRIFWVDDLEGEHYAVESAALDGTDRKNVSKSLFHAPFNLAIDRKSVYWTDQQANAIWSVSKNAAETDEPIKMQSFNLVNPPIGIVTRNHFFSSQTKNPECESVLNALQPKITSETMISSTSILVTNAMPNIVPAHFCLNNGYLNPKTNQCICQRGCEGVHCETRMCHNYCVEGTCHISSTSYLQCECKPGFIGERCEIDLCTGYCLNGGQCRKENNEPNCECRPSFSGRHCEIMDVNDLCRRHCNNETVDIITIDWDNLCSCDKNGTFTSSDGTFAYGVHENGACQESVINKTAIFVTCGVVISLALVFAIVHTIRHAYKPLRPRIKKTYVVHKNVVPTPLTCRPTTEQCEITIENCCNMNICDTPCFDPKTLQSEERKKDDKKTLLNNCEDLMY